MEHRLGGHPTFYLDDPRPSLNEAEEPYIQLLQIKPELLTDNGWDVEAGTAEIHFFIRPSALRQFDLSSIAYHVQFAE